MKWKLLTRSVIAFFGALALYVMWTAWAIWTFPCNEGGRTDAAIVLGASAHNGQPSPVFAERINHGLDLYRQGAVGKLIFTGGTPDSESVSLAEVASRFAVGRGVPSGDIVLEPYSQTTYENLQYARQIADSRGLRTFLIVSDPLHMRRAMRMAADLHMNARASATPTTRYRSLRSRLRFLRRETCFYLQYVLVSRFFGERSIEDAETQEKSLRRQLPPPNATSDKTADR
jgi:uncharacterized SAM-binding protein YcdF (DUF218 family)